jgi:predicted PurR-regulated permease PerM
MGCLKKFWDQWNESPRVFRPGFLKMNTTPTSPAPTASTLQAVGMAVFGIALLWLPVLALHLTPAFFAALMTYSATRALATRLHIWRPDMRHAEGLALLCILILIITATTSLVEYASGATGSLPQLLQQMALVLEQLRSALPPLIADHLPASLDALRELAATWLREHSGQLELWGGHTLRGIGYVIAGTVIGALAALQLPAQAPPVSQTAPLVSALRGRFDELVESFANVVFAQLRISVINTALTAVLLLAIMPMVGRSLPMTGTLLVVTFIAGLLPVIGNLISNAVIVIIALSSSLVDSGLALAWLVGIHKLEYFLNAHIIGTRIRAHAWELLTMMLVMESFMGLAGLVSAPVIYAQLKHRLHQQGWID